MLATLLAWSALLLSPWLSLPPEALIIEDSGSVFVPIVDATEAARAKVGVARAEVVARGSERTLVRASGPLRRKSEMAWAGYSGYSRGPLPARN